MKELLQAKYPATLQRFTSPGNIDDSKLSDVRLARKAGGFAFEYWHSGGDIKDISRLLEHFNSMLGSKYFEEETSEELYTRQSVMTKIHQRASSETRSETFGAGNVWNLDFNQRQSLLREWKEEIDPQTVVDKTAEIHRRHQAATKRFQEVWGQVNARCLQERMLVPIFLRDSMN